MKVPTANTARFREGCAHFAITRDYIVWKNMDYKIVNGLLIKNYKYNSTYRYFIILTPINIPKKQGYRKVSLNTFIQKNKKWNL